GALALRQGEPHRIPALLVDGCRGGRVHASAGRPSAAFPAMPRSLPARALILAAAAAAALAYHERRPEALPAIAEALPPPPEMPEEPTWTPDLREPQPAEVIAAVERAFPRVLPPETLPVHRAVSGDFNGDRSPDLAVPARALAEMLPE